MDIREFFGFPNSRIVDNEYNVVLELILKPKPNPPTLSGSLTGAASNEAEIPS